MEAREGLLKEREIIGKQKSDLIRTTWGSAGVFVGGSVVALTWLAEAAASTRGWEAFAGVLVVGLLVSAILVAYQVILLKWTKIDEDHQNRLWAIDKDLDEGWKLGSKGSKSGTAKPGNATSSQPAYVRYRPNERFAWGAWDAFKAIFWMAAAAPLIPILVSAWKAWQS